MKNQILRRYKLLDRFEQILVVSVLALSSILVLSLILFAWTGDNFIQSIYEQRSLPVLNRLIQNHEQLPLEHYLALKTQIAMHVFLLWSLAAGFMTSGLIILNRLFFSDKKLSASWVIFVCSAATALLYLYNTDLKIISTHTFFRAQAVYQIMNGNCPPMDPLFGGETLHYQWGYAWAAAAISKILHITPFNSFGIINVLSLAGCLWLLYKISNLLIDNPKINIFSAVFTIYCNSIFNNLKMEKLKDIFPFYPAESRVFPLLIKFHKNNGAPLGLFFFLLMVFGTMKLFEKKKTAFYSVVILLSTICCLFFFAAYGPAIVAWAGFIGLLWLTKYKTENFRPFGRTLLTVLILIILSLLIVSPYFRQISSSGGFLNVQFFCPKFILNNSLNFLFTTFLTVLIIIVHRRYLTKNLNRQNLSILMCLFLSTIACYLFLHFPSRVEYKFLLLALTPFGIIGGIAFSRIQQFSKWLALALFFILILPSLQLYRYQFASSPRKIFDLHYAAPYYENGMILESSDAEENSMYQWIRANTSMDDFFLDAETKIPVYAQRCLWVGFDTGKKLPGYAMSMPRLKLLHGYDDQEYSQRQEVAQNIFGPQESLTEEQIAAYLIRNRIFVIVRDENISFPMRQPGFQEVFVSENKRFRVISPVLQPTDDSASMIK